MKRRLRMSAVLLISVIPTACGTFREGRDFRRDTVPEMTLVPAEEGRSFSEHTCGVSGNYTWVWPSGGNENTRFDAVGPGPHDIATWEDAEHLEISRPITMSLVWEERQPDDVSVVCLDISAFGMDPGTEDETAYIVEAEVVPDGDGIYLLELQAGRVYDILAVWNEVKGCSFGEAHFYVITEEPSPWEFPGIT